jgi:hypothetical protein
MPKQATQQRRPATKRRAAPRRGQASLDYVLVLGVILPLVAFMVTQGRRILGLVYELLCVLVSWPFM